MGRESSGRDYRGLRVLVAENTAQTPSSICQILEQFGCKTQTAANTGEILTALRHGAISFSPFHLLIIDEHFLEGIEPILSRVHQESGGRKTKVALLVSPERTEQHQSLSAIDALLQKPLDASAVQTVLQKVCDASHPSEEKGRILVVEDDDLSLELMRILLTKNGYRATLTSNGIDAVKAFATHPFDLILLDLQMPIMDGFQTAKQIRELEASRSRIPIIALTASHLSSEAYAQFNGEIDLLLTKPFEVQYVLRAIQACIGGEPRAAALMDVKSALPHFSFDPDQFREIFAEFQRSLPGRLATLEAALHCGDLETLARLAHNLKGVSANVGAMQLSEMAGQLDQQCDDAQTGRIPSTVADIRSAIMNLQNNATQQIEAYLTSQANVTVRDK